jgi:hypothetical protein
LPIVPKPRVWLPVLMKIVDIASIVNAIIGAVVSF